MTKDLNEAMRRADANALEAYRGMPAGSLDIFTVQCVTKAALASLAHQGWVLVPREATEAMTDALVFDTPTIAGMLPRQKEAAMKRAQERLDAMLAAAPKAGGSE